LNVNAEEIASLISDVRLFSAAPSNACHSSYKSESGVGLHTTVLAVLASKAGTAQVGKQTVLKYFVACSQKALALNVFPFEPEGSKRLLALLGSVNSVILLETVVSKSAGSERSPPLSRPLSHLLQGTKQQSHK